MTDGPPEDELAEAAEPTMGEPDPEEYEAGGDDTVSPDTGTVYEGTAHEPAATPHDTAAREAAEDDGE